ncbi:MAG: alanine racemase [Vicinamibacteria bacterium]|nr:alanine racemase [Vicinamibacteria bacterium]
MTAVEPSRHPATAWVNLDRIRENFRAIRNHAGARAVIPVLKADAYGHGAIAVARALDPMGVAMFAVAYVEEGLALRRAGITTPILILTGFAPEQLNDVAAFNLTPVVSTAEQVRALQGLHRGEDEPRLPVHVKVDTGMARLGFTLHELEPVIHRLEDAESIHLEGLMTHLSAADEDPTETARQLDVFEEAILRLETLGIRPRMIHAANSAGLAFTRASHSAVRPGLLLYGIPPRPLAPSIPVKPALELRARVALVKTVPPGTRVSYGGHFVAAQETRIATINAGYADGIPRTTLMREQGVLRHGPNALKVTGTVCMDLTMLDASLCPTLKAGDEVTVMGDSPGAWDLAEWAGTNAWQILTGVGSRVPRRYTLGGEILPPEPR